MLDTALRSTLDATLQSAMAYLENVATAPVQASGGVEETRQRLGKPLGEEGIAPEKVISELVRDTAASLLGSGGGRFFAWVIGGCLPAALGADWLTATWDQNAALCACSPASAIVEEVAGEWLKELLGIPRTASFAFVSGCQMAHATCLAAARHALLLRAGLDVEQRGLYQAPPIRIFASTTQHGSFARAVRFLGLGLEQVTRIQVNAEERMPATGLERALAQSAGQPAIVLLQAGEINTGSYDDFARLIPVAHAHGAWVHVDGAFGLWAAASPKFQHLARGIAEADSWVTDGHKWLNVPYDCAYAFVANREAHRAAMSHREPYLVHASDARDQIDWNPEWSRRARGFPTYAALRQLGTRGIAAQIERCCGHAQALAQGIGNLPGAELLWTPIINQGLVRFPDPHPGASAEDHDRRTDRIIAAINASGEAFFGATTWRGRRAMRISVCNWQTSELDVQRTVGAVADCLGAASP